MNPLDWTKGVHSNIDIYFKSHHIVIHSKGEYVREAIHANTIENYFSILKRGLIGIYQHVGPQHLKRYIGEYDFRYSTRKLSDSERTDKALRGIAGKRLLYRDSSRPIAG